MNNQHSSIQAHSMGELFPCVIAKIERYPDGETAASAAPGFALVYARDELAAA